MQKTYFPISSTNYSSFTNTPLEITLPSYFRISQSKNKYIVVRNCKIVLHDALVNDIKFHSDIVQENAYDDHFICFTNELMVKPKKYHWNSQNNTIKIWFTDIKNNIIPVEDYLIDILLVY